MAVITVIARDVAVYRLFGVARTAAKGNGPIFHEIRNDHYCRMCRVEGPMVEPDLERRRSSGEPWMAKQGCWGEEKPVRPQWVEAPRKRRRWSHV